MTGNKIKKIIAGILIFGQIAFWPSLVFAQTATVGAVNPVPSNDTGTLAANTLFNTQLAFVKADLDLCNHALQVFNSTDKATSTVLKFGLIIGGGPGVADYYFAEEVAYQDYLDCLQGSGPPFSPPSVPSNPLAGVLPNLNLIVAPNLYTANIKQQMIAQVNASIQTYKTKLQASIARYNNASSGIWKALLITILLNTSKAVADALVAKLVNNYKISNLKQYTDSVATLMYDNQFIRDNFPNNQDQLMARAILTNPLVRTQIQPAIFVAANAALGYDPTALNPASPTFYSQMAMAGNSSANPYFLQSAYVAGADQSHASAMAAAQRQISQGSGYKAPVNCAGTLAQQKQIDAADTAAQAQLQNRQALFNSLVAAKNAGQNVNPVDLAKAQSDLIAATNTWNNLPNTVTGAQSNTGTSSLVSNLASGSNTEGTMAIVMCEAVSSPAVLVNQGIDAVFKALGANLTQYNSNNLPAFINTMSGIATQIGSSMVLGGLGAGSTSALLNENQAVTATAVLAGQYANANAASQANLTGPIIFYSTQGSGNTSSLSWNVLTTTLTTASYVMIAGLGAPTGQQPLSGSANVSPTGTANYVLTVYDPNGKSLGTMTTSVTGPASSTTTGTSPSSGTGASQSKITFSVPSATLNVGKSQIYSFQLYNSDGSLSQSTNFQVNSLSPTVATVLSENNGQDQFSVSAVAAGSALIVVTWSDDTGTVINSQPFTVTVLPAGQSAYNYNTPTVALSSNPKVTPSGVEEVAGAFTAQPATLPRGQAVIVTPRGD